MAGSSTSLGSNPSNNRDLPTLSRPQRRPGCSRFTKPLGVPEDAVAWPAHHGSMASRWACLENVMNRLFSSCRIACWMILSVFANSAGAAFPERPIHIVVPFAAGSAPDILARLLGEGWKRSGFADVVVVNQPGAGGTLGVAQAARAAPDGYTLAIAGDAALVVNPSLYEDSSLSPLSDLAMVSQLIVTPTV